MSRAHLAYVIVAASDRLVYPPPDDAVMGLLKSFGPWQLDSELRQLSPAPGSSPKLLRLFLTTLQHQIDTGRDFEFAQACLGLFLKVRGIPRRRTAPKPWSGALCAAPSQLRAPRSTQFSNEPSSSISYNSFYIWPTREMPIHTSGMTNR